MKEDEKEDGELDSATKAALVKELVELKERKNRLGRLVAELEGYGSWASTMSVAIAAPQHLCMHVHCTNTASVIILSVVHWTHR